MSGDSLDTVKVDAEVALLREIAMRLNQGISVPFPSDTISAGYRYTIISPL